MYMRFDCVVVGGHAVDSAPWNFWKRRSQRIAIALDATAQTPINGDA